MQKACLLNDTLSIFNTCETTSLYQNLSMCYMFVRFSRGSVDTCTYKTCVECAFCSSQGAGLSHAVTSTKGFTLKTRSPVQSKRKENGTSLSDLACQRAYSLAQSCTFGHVHEAVHALRHLLAEAHSLPPPTHQPPHHHHPSTHPPIHSPSPHSVLLCF